MRKPPLTLNNFIISNDNVNYEINRMRSKLRHYMVIAKKMLKRVFGNTTKMNKILYSLLFITILSIAIFSFAIDKQLLNPTSTYPRIVIDNKATVSIETAKTQQEQQQGLSNRERLESNHGMLFIFEKPGIYSFWMKDMKFPLDFIWIDQNNIIVDLHENVPAQSADTSFINLPTIQPRTPITQVLEVNAGFIAKWGIAIGDRVVLEGY